MNTKKDNNKHKKNLKILKQNNNNYESRISFGIFNIKKKNLKEAKLNFEQAIEIDRSRYEAYLNLSNLYILLDNITDGINILEKFIQINKYNKHIINNLSVFYFKNSQYEDLDKLLSQFIKKDKNHILLYLKANLFLKKNKIQKAIELFKKSLNINKNYWAAYEDLLASLEKLNQLKDLEKYILEAKINFLHEIKLYYYESLYLFRIKDYNRSLKIIFKNNLDKKFKNDMYLVNVLDLLSKNFEKLKNFEKSFYYALQRNKILLQLDDNKKYNKKIILETITVYKIFFKKKNFNKFTLSSDFISHNNLIFLVGFPRSGTTLLDSILRTHSKTLVLEEKPFLLNVRHDFFTKNNNNIEALNVISKKEIIILQNKYFNQINNLNLYKNKIIIDKFPLNIIELGFIKTIFPKAKIILALRHPCDVVLSSFLTLFKMNDAMANFKDIVSSAYFYNEVFDLFENYQKLFKLNCYNIKYEDVVLNFTKTISELLEFLGLNYEKNIEQFYEIAKKRDKINTPSYSQVSQPLYTDSINRWKGYKEIELVYPILQKWITKYNYL